MKKRSAAEQWLPLGYFGAALLLVLALLPSVLRPPPEQSTNSAEFSPDAPVEAPNAMVSSLSRASSATAGTETASGALPGEHVGNGDPVTDMPRPGAGNGRCFGMPPRQTESIYSAPCAAAWKGDNGGATMKNVTGTEIRIGVWHSNGTPPAGPIATTPATGEGAPMRTMRVLQTYFNQRFETYGRQIRLFALPGGETATEARNAAVVADDEWGLFAIRDIRHESCAEGVRRGLMNFCNPLHRRDHAAAAPYRWSWMMDRTTMDELSAEYMCKQLVGRPARFTSDPTLAGKPRTFGLVVENSPQRLGRPDVLAGAFDEACGGSFDPVIELASRQDPASVGAAVTRLKSQGVTSVVFDGNYVIALQMMTTADGQAYQPEWLLFGSSGLDFNAVGQLLPPSQMRSVFGLTAWELPRPPSQQDCAVAYKSIDPTGEPAPGTCTVHFPDLLQIMNGIQAAGPKLTPETFHAGLHRMGQRWPVETWGIGGGFGPGDWTYQDDVAEIWWDPAAIAPENDQPGAFRWVRGGQRFRPGEIPDRETLAFQDGVVGA